MQLAARYHIGGFRNIVVILVDEHFISVVVRHDMLRDIGEWILLLARLAFEVYTDIWPLRKPIGDGDHVFLG